MFFSLSSFANDHSDITQETRFVLCCDGTGSCRDLSEEDCDSRAAARQKFNEEQIIETTDFYSLNRDDDCGTNLAIDLSKHPDASLYVVIDCAPFTATSDLQQCWVSPVIDCMTNTIDIAVEWPRIDEKTIGVTWALPPQTGEVFWLLLRKDIVSAVQKDLTCEF